MLWLLIGSPGGPCRAHAASKQLLSERGSEGARERAARLQATCLSPSQGASKAHPGTGSQGGSQFSAIHQLPSCCLGGRAPKKTAPSPDRREQVSPTRVAGLQRAPGMASSLSKAWQLPRGGLPLAQTSAGLEGAGRLETSGENQAFGSGGLDSHPPHHPLCDPRQVTSALQTSICPSVKWRPK